jgi:hypothetical protein
MPKGKLATADESQLAAEIREKIGAGPDEEVEVTTPQFERGPMDAKPPPAPRDLQWWNDLRRMSRAALRELGCGQWNDPNDPDEHDRAESARLFGEGYVLMLFPGEWYGSIPAGYLVTDIFGENEPFEPGVSDNDIRFGCLPYGIAVL